MVCHQQGRLLPCMGRCWSGSCSVAQWSLNGCSYPRQAAHTDPGAALGGTEPTRALQAARGSPSCGCAQYDASLRSILLYKEGRGGVSSAALGGLSVGPVYEIEA